ncbi:hypothetical protein AX774_g5591 [Zancudomyces culisetae]|uniref:VPS9 domain-containing protein n=1 Tax=Zancudomyces culisetae TaxID=1213189 RepID=A0A1R1PJ37_ZANCU|nr:hypothetical protein AX774_g5591 [Zancudomyces culisetae]|eukprot:OMH80967.1 hypothetical protein AX774_g5591 [Zancudomyces culisetae]
MIEPKQVGQGDKRVEKREDDGEDEKSEARESMDSSGMPPIVELELDNSDQSLEVFSAFLNASTDSIDPSKDIYSGVYSDMDKGIECEKNDAESRKLRGLIRMLLEQGSLVLMFPLGLQSLKNKSNDTQKEEIMNNTFIVINDKGIPISKQIVGEGNSTSDKAGCGSVVEVKGVDIVGLSGVYGVLDDSMLKIGGRLTTSIPDLLLEICDNDKDGNGGEDAQFMNDALKMLFSHLEFGNGNIEYATRNISESRITCEWKSKEGEGAEREQENNKVINVTVVSLVTENIEASRIPINEFDVHKVELLRRIFEASTVFSDGHDINNKDTKKRDVYRRRTRECGVDFLQNVSQLAKFIVEVNKYSRVVSEFQVKDKQNGHVNSVDGVDGGRNSRNRNEAISDGSGNNSGGGGGILGSWFKAPFASKQAVSSSPTSDARSSIIKRTSSVLQDGSTRGMTPLVQDCGYQVLDVKRINVVINNKSSSDFYKIVGEKYQELMESIYKGIRSNEHWVNENRKEDDETNDEMRDNETCIFGIMEEIEEYVMLQVERSVMSSGIEVLQQEILEKIASNGEIYKEIDTEQENTDEMAAVVKKWNRIERIFNKFDSDLLLEGDIKGKKKTQKSRNGIRISSIVEIVRELANIRIQTDATEKTEEIMEDGSAVNKEYEGAVDADMLLSLLIQTIRQTERPSKLFCSAIYLETFRYKRLLTSFENYCLTSVLASINYILIQYYDKQQNQQQGGQNAGTAKGVAGINDSGGSNSNTNTGGGNVMSTLGLSKGLDLFSGVAGSGIKAAANVYGAVIDWPSSASALRLSQASKSKLNTSTNNDTNTRNKDSTNSCGGVIGGEAGIGDKRIQEMLKTQQKLKQKLKKNSNVSNANGDAEIGSDGKLNLPINKKYVELDNANELKIGEVEELLQAYKQLAEYITRML